MGFLNALGRWIAAGLERRSSSVAPLLVDGGEVRWSGKNYEAYAREAYLKNVIAYACINEIGRAIAQVDWDVFRREGRRGKRVEVEDHPILDLIDNPAPMESFSFLMFSAWAFLGLTGNTYIERVRLLTDSKGAPRELYVLRPDRTKILVNTQTGVLKGYEYQVGSRKRVFEADPVTGQCDLLHIKLLHPTDDWYGAAPTETASREIDTNNAAAEYHMGLLQNNARPGMLFLFKQMLSDLQYKQLDDKLKENFTGARAGKNLILHGEGADAKPYGFNPQEMDFLEGDREKARRIALAWGVPPMLLGIPGDNTYSNYESAMLAFWEGPVMFYLNLLGDKLSRWLFRPEERLVLVPDLDSIPALEPRRRETWTKANEAKFLSVNEKRLMVGYDEVPNGDVILVSSSDIPLDQAVLPPEPPPAALPAENAPDDEDVA